MADTFGYAFTPGLQQRFTNSLNTQAQGLPPTASQALQVLSLRLPNILGGQPIAPDALLRPRLGGATPDAAVRAQTSGAVTGPAPIVPAGPLTNPAANPIASPLTISSAPGQSADMGAALRAIASAMPGLISPTANAAAPDQGPAPASAAPPPSIIFKGPQSWQPTTPTGPIGSSTPDFGGLMNRLFGGGDFRV